jgi:hypothetical protein
MRIEVEHWEESGSVREYICIYFPDEEYPTIEEEENFLIECGMGKELKLGLLSRVGFEGVNKVVYEGQLSVDG